VTTPLRARLRYPVGSRWLYSPPTAWGPGHLQFVGDELEWWAVETADACLVPAPKP
jgi:hypothetical protein